MKALSIQQPWADRILFEGKDIENRSWPLPSWMKGKRIYLHAGKRTDGPYTLENPNRLGAIVGAVTIVEGVSRSSSPWFFGPYGFVLSKPVAYNDPIPCKGSLGFLHS